MVVTGGAQAAHRAVAALLAADARVTVIAPEITPVLESLAAAGSVRWLGRHYTAGDLDGAWYAVTATGDPARDADVAAEAERSRVFCLCADDPAGSTAATGTDASGTEENEQAGSKQVGSEEFPAGTVVLVGGGPGDPGLITVRGLRTLRRADVVVADHLAPQELLAALRPEVELVDASKLPRGRAMAQERINDLLVEHARAGRRVVRLKGGDPFVFGRGMEEVQACTAAGVAVQVVPGITSAVGVPALAGIPVTHRGLTHEFAVVSGHLPPGHPHSLVDWPALGRLRGTLVVLMGVENAPAIAAALIAHGRAPDTPVAIVADGSTRTQRSVRTTLAGLPGAVAEAAIRPPAVWVVGEVAAFA